MQKFAPLSAARRDTLLQPQMTITRREFVFRVARAGGFGAAFMTMNSLGLLGMVETDPAHRLSPTSINRPGDESDHSRRRNCRPRLRLRDAASRLRLHRAGSARAPRRPQLDSAPRIETGLQRWHDRKSAPSTKATISTAARPVFHPIHKNILGYCNELGVALEVEVNTSRSTLLQNDDVFDGKPIRQAQAVNDTRGHVAELLAKCVQKGALDQEFTPDDHAARDGFSKVLRRPEQELPVPRLLALRRPAVARRRRSDRNSTRSAFLLRSAPSRSSGAPCSSKKCSICRPPCSSQWAAWIVFPTPSPALWETSSTTTLRSRKLEKPPTASECCTATAKQGRFASIEAPYCICALPLTILKTFPNDFAPRVKSAIQQVPYDSAYKVAWESRRFWEQDGDEIYGGLSFLTSGPVSVGVVSERESDVAARSRHLRLRRGKLG